MSISEKLAKIQRELKAPKSQYNNFGKYKYRNCEDILEALKPHLNGVHVRVSDDIKVIGDRVYVVATATISDGTEALSTTAYAREPLNKKGMDESQITGAASSYARKYALNGLFLIDDTKDADGHAPEQVSVAYTNEQKATFDALMQSGNAVDLFLFNKTFDTQDASSASASAWVGLTNSFQRGQKGKQQAIMQKLISDGRERLGEAYMALRDAIDKCDDVAASEALDGLNTNAVEFIKNKLNAEEIKYLNEVMT